MLSFTFTVNSFLNDFRLFSLFSPSHIYFCIYCQAALMWCKNNSNNAIKFRKKISSFFGYIHFEYIPCDVLVREIYPLKIVPNFTMIRALAHQADPSLEDFPSMEDLMLTPSPVNSPKEKVLELHETIQKL